MPISDYAVDYQDRSVTAWCLQDNPLNQTYKAIHRDYMGCTLVEHYDEAYIRSQDVGVQTPPPPLDINTPWPEGEGFFPENAPAGVDLECLAAASQRQFDETFTYNTRAITVSFQGYLVFEQYASEFNITADTRMPPHCCCCCRCFVRC